MNWRRMSTPTMHYSPAKLALALCAVMVLLSSGGCNALKTDSTRVLDPSRVIKAPKHDAPVMHIRSSIGAADQSDELVPGAVFPTDEDRTYTDEDYILRPGDVVMVSVLDLFNEGQEASFQKRLTESGFIDLPELKERIYAAGMNKEGLKEAIIRAYSPDIIKVATVSVTLLARRQSTVSINGSFDRPGQYEIARRDMRLLEAIALAGGIIQPNMAGLRRYIYVIRQAPATIVKQQGPARTGPTQGAGLGELPRLPSIPGLDAPPPEARPGESTSTPKASPAPAPAPLQPAGPELAPLEPAQPVQLPEFVPPTDEPKTDEPKDEPKTGEPEAKPATIPPVKPEETPAEPSTQPQPSDAEGQEAELKKLLEGSSPEMPPPSVMPLMSEMSSAAPHPSGPPTIALPGSSAEAKDDTSDDSDPYGWKDAGKASGLSRVIAIDLDRLEGGDDKMNIVIRDKDVVYLPQLKIGEFYMWGEVNRPGVYSLTGRRVTLRQAIAAAGNFGPLAWPANSTLTRRVGYSEEQTVPLDLERIMRGLDPDIYLKPNDVIGVGTHAGATFMAVLRSAFRFTYGFGFIYDRNFGFQNRGNNPWARW